MDRLALLPRVRVVLVNTSHPGNIGAAARAMKTMGLSTLYLVEPRYFPHADATARASGADDLLAEARVCGNLADALAGCQWVVGASARLRSIPVPPLLPQVCAEQVMDEAEAGEVALLFGREQSGLTNDELDHCHALVHIPTNPEYGSLNIAAAVQVMTYAVRMAAMAEWVPPEAVGEDTPLAGHDDVERFYAHLEDTLVDLDFLDPDNPRLLMRRLRRLFGRVRLDQNELNILRGILAAAQKAAGRGG